MRRSPSAGSGIKSYTSFGRNGLRGQLMIGISHLMGTHAWPSRLTPSSRLGISARSCSSNHMHSGHWQSGESGFGHSGMSSGGPSDSSVSQSSPSVICFRAFCLSFMADRSFANGSSISCSSSSLSRSRTNLRLVSKSFEFEARLESHKTGAARKASSSAAMSDAYSLSKRTSSYLATQAPAS